MATNKRTRKNGLNASCTVCGVGTALRTEICVKCATALLERGGGAIKATGLIPQPQIDEGAIEKFVQATFWERWE